MTFRSMHLLFYIGLSVLCIGVLFKIQHWPGAQMNIMAGVIIETIFNTLILIEIFTSKKASTQTKLIWGIGYSALLLSFLFFFKGGLVLLFLVFATGNYYLRIGRKKFLKTKGKFDHITFDSIDV